MVNRITVVIYPVHDPGPWDETFEIENEVDPDGAFVYYTDYEALQAKYDKLVEEFRLFKLSAIDGRKINGLPI